MTSLRNQSNLNEAAIENDSNHSKFKPKNPVTIKDFFNGNVEHLRPNKSS
jgi:hypothetical protein